MIGSNNFKFHIFYSTTKHEIIQITTSKIKVELNTQTSKQKINQFRAREYADSDELFLSEPGRGRPHHVCLQLCFQSRLHASQVSNHPFFVFKVLKFYE